MTDRQRRESADEIRAQLRDVVDRMARDDAAALLRVLQPRPRTRTGQGRYWLSPRTRTRRKARDREIAERAREGDTDAAGKVEKRRARQAAYRARQVQAWLVESDAESAAAVARSNGWPDAAHVRHITRGGPRWAVSLGGGLFLCRDGEARP